MIDVDHFKRFNDDFGHDAGDAVLCAVAEVLNERTRLADVACRYGGEEFALVFPGMVADVATRRMETVRRQIESQKLVHAGRPLQQVTISAGIAVFPGDGDDTEALDNAADQALYRAKNAGRNRICLATEDASGPHGQNSDADDARPVPPDKIMKLSELRQAKRTA